MKQCLSLCALVLASVSCSGASAGTLDEVRERGRMICGVSSGAPGFALPDTNDEWQGFDVAICRSVAAAVLGDATAVDFVVPDPDARFAALANGELDILLRNTGWTFSLDVEQKFSVAGVNYYDGQGFLVPRDLPVTSAKDLDGAKICAPGDASIVESLADYFKTNNMENVLVPVLSSTDGQKRYLAGECDAYTGYLSELAAMRASFENAGAHALLPEIISKEPLGPLVRHGDDEWGDIVRWTLNALIAAEEFGVTSANLAEMSAAPGNTPEVNRMLGTEGNLGELIGLSADWAKNAIAVSGNYGEIFEKNIGVSTPIGLARGLNAQWANGGLLYAAPFR